MNKKAQGLPMNTVVIAILVIVVLVLVVTFFFGGFTGLSMKVREIFYGSLAGTTKTLAIQQCNQYCTQLELQGKTSNFGNSAFCRKRSVDLNEDGKIEDKEKINCVHDDLGVSCSYTVGDESVDVDCSK